MAGVIPFVEAIIEADIDAFAGLLSLNRFRFGHEATQFLRQKGRENPNFFAQAVATMMCYRYAIDFVYEPMRHQSKAWCELVSIIRRVRQADEANEYIKDLIVNGTLVEGTGVPAGLVAFFAAEYQGAIFDFAMDALNKERLCFTAFFDRPFDEVPVDYLLSRQTDVEGPVAEVLASMSTYPLASTRKMCRLIETWYSLFRRTPINMLLELIHG